MIYAFRIIQDDTSISHHGIVTASSLKDLFWAIDEYVNPYDVEVKKIKHISMCFKTNKDDDEELASDEHVFMEIDTNPCLELSSFMYEEYALKEGWFSPNFKNINL